MWIWGRRDRESCRTSVPTLPLRLNRKEPNLDGEIAIEKSGEGKGGQKGRYGDTGVSLKNKRRNYITDVCKWIYRTPKPGYTRIHTYMYKISRNTCSPTLRERNTFLTFTVIPRRNGSGAPIMLQRRVAMHLNPPLGAIYVPPLYAPWVAYTFSLASARVSAGKCAGARDEKRDYSRRDVERVQKWKRERRERERERERV